MVIIFMEVWHTMYEDSRILKEVHYNTNLAINPDIKCLEDIACS